jgi:hypothetical protein
MCKNCYTCYKEKISRFQYEEITSDEGNMAVKTVNNFETYVPENEVTEGLNVWIKNYARWGGGVVGTLQLCHANMI